MSVILCVPNKTDTYPLHLAPRTGQTPPKTHPAPLSQAMPEPKNTSAQNRTPLGRGAGGEVAARLAPLGSTRHRANRHLRTPGSTWHGGGCSSRIRRSSWQGGECSSRIRRSTRQGGGCSSRIRRSTRQGGECSSRTRRRGWHGGGCFCGGDGSKQTKKSPLARPQEAAISDSEATRCPADRGTFDCERGQGECVGFGVNSG